MYKRRLWKLVKWNFQLIVCFLVLAIERYSWAKYGFVWCLINIRYTQNCYEIVMLVQAWSQPKSFHYRWDYIVTFSSCWHFIRQIQGKDPSVTITQDIPEDDDSEERFEEVLDSTGPIELPPCELSKLEEIAELFNSVLPSPIRREKLALAIEQDNYIRKLLDLFHICEDLENLDGLHHLYDIFKSLFFMNKPSLLEIMLADDLVFDVVGCLEYDPSKAAPQRHRAFLKESANFKEIIPITNSDVINKIHQTYRVQYICDAILPPPSVFEDNMLASVNSFILFNRIEIVTHLQVSL